MQNAIVSLGLVLGIPMIIAILAKIADKIRRDRLVQRQIYANKSREKVNDAIEQCKINRQTIKELYPKYKAIDLHKELWNALDNVSTSLQLFDDNINKLIREGDTKVVNSAFLLNKYRKEHNDLQKQVQDNLTRLEKIEKELYELTIDCNIAIGEFEHSTDAICSKINGVEIDDYISIEKMNSWIELVQICLSQSNQEIDNFRKFKSTNEYYLNYSCNVEKQKAIVSDIEKDISQINRLGMGVGSDE